MVRSLTLSGPSACKDSSMHALLTISVFETIVRSSSFPAILVAAMHTMGGIIIPI